MDKRIEANIRVKQSITDSLFTLMHKKNFAKITVTEIVAQANVARASYYRNYKSKEDILTTLVYDVCEDFKRRADYELTEYFSYKNVHRAFAYFSHYQKYILDLYHGGFISTLLETLNRFHEENAGVMSIHSMEKYKLYVFIGALFNTGIVWLENGTKENIDDFSEAFCKCIGITE
jgi:AcrR family transcriptional regulator